MRNTRNPWKALNTTKRMEKARRAFSTVPTLNAHEIPKRIVRPPMAMISRTVVWVFLCLDLDFWSVCLMRTAVTMTKMTQFNRTMAKIGPIKAPKNTPA